MGDWIRYDENYGTECECLFAHDNEHGKYDVAAVIWTAREKPYTAFEAQFTQGDKIDDLTDINNVITVVDIDSAVECIPHITDPYVTTIIGEFDTLEEAEIAVDRFYMTADEFAEAHPNA